jgi:hypothetical protein|nr:MAG TPA: hypothetical protein [Caudoviricetes sp.]
MKIFGVDIGFGDCKCVIGDETGIKNVFKFPSVVGMVEKNEMVNDERLIPYLEKYFYVGEDALHLPTDTIIDISDYNKLEYFAPLFIYKTFAMLESTPDILVLGLSIAQIKNSGYYKERIEKYLEQAGVKCNIFVLPQGAIAKLAVDKYGINFPTENINFNKNASYILADMGFNTLDVCHVINGQTSSNLVIGLEGKGAIVMAEEVQKGIKESYNIDLSISEVKDVLVTNNFKRRGKVYACDKLVSDAKLNYQNMLIEIIEANFGKVLDKVDNLIMVGGGATFFKTEPTSFMQAPKNKPEYYNAIGYYEYGLQKSK